MKSFIFFKSLLISLLISSSISVIAEEDSARIAFIIDSINTSFTYTTTGEVTLTNKVSVLKIPQGYKFLDKEQSRFVLEDLWGNPPDEEIDGMLFPENYAPLDSNCWAFVVSYSEMGYIKDKDADKINYDDLLKDLKKDSDETNKARTEMGYEEVHLIGWASTPFYDNSNKALHWAKELQFGNGEYGNTINYDVRFLGRKGVLSFNAVGSMHHLPEIKESIPVLISSASFTEGNKYSNFDPKIDQVAAVGIGGLVAGKVLAKAGLLAGLAKFGKVIFIGLAAFGAAIWKFLKGRRRQDEFTGDSELALDTGTTTMEDTTVEFDETQENKNTPA